MQNNAGVRRTPEARGRARAPLFQQKPRGATKEGQWVLRTPPAYYNPCFSLLGIVIRTLVSFQDPFAPIQLPRWALLTVLSEGRALSPKFHFQTLDSWILVMRLVRVGRRSAREPGPERFAHRSHPRTLSAPSFSPQGSWTMSCSGAILLLLLLLLYSCY